MGKSKQPSGPTSNNLLNIRGGNTDKDITQPLARYDQGRHLSRKPTRLEEGALTGKGIPPFKS